MVKVRNVEIGTGKPKICVPIVENTQEDILEMGETLMAKKSVDIIEWRIDFFEDCFDIKKLVETAGLLRDVVLKKPVLATFRTKNEGGEKEIEQKVYIEMLEKLSGSGYIDMIDVEVYFMEKDETRQFIKRLKENTVVVGSYHDFEKTPSYEEIYERLGYMEEIGADIPKVACMPKETADVFTLMKATDDFVAQGEDRNVITMSMGEKGKISRIAGKTFGSALTFGCLGKASAPGQINADDLEIVLNII